MKRMNLTGSEPKLQKKKKTLILAVGLLAANPSYSIIGGLGTFIFPNKSHQH